MITEQEWKQARRRLRDLLPWARAEAAKRGDVVESTSHLGDATFPYVTEERLEALLIYPGPKGGWHADLTLKDMPHGIPNTLGTPVGEPCATRAEAEERGKRTIVMALMVARRNAQEPREAPPPVFRLYDDVFTLSPILLEAALERMPQWREGYGSPLQAAGRVEAMLDRLCPHGFEHGSFDAWPREKRIPLLVVLHIAALSGLFIYPMRQDAPPKPTGVQS